MHRRARTRTIWHALTFTCSRKSSRRLVEPMDTADPPPRNAPTNRSCHTPTPGQPGSLCLHMPPTIPHASLTRRVSPCMDQYFGFGFPTALGLPFFLSLSASTSIVCFSSSASFTCPTPIMTGPPPAPPCAIIALPPNADQHPALQVVDSTLFLAVARIDSPNFIFKRQASLRPGQMAVNRLPPLPSYWIQCRYGLFVQK